MAIFKDPSSTNSLFAGRNLPSFVKDFILKRYISADGSVNRQGLTDFLDKVIPERQTEVKDRLDAGEELTLLTRFIIYIDLVKGLRRFGIPDLGIKSMKDRYRNMYIRTIEVNLLMEKNGVSLKLLFFQMRTEKESCGNG